MEPDNEELKEKLIDNLSEGEVDYLQDIHAKNYMGTDDDMSDAFETWLVNLSYEEIKELLTPYE